MKAYASYPAADERELSAIRLAEAVLAAEDVVEAHRREMLGIAVWKYTEARAGKYGLRYRTPAALAAVAETKLQHEHVHTKKGIVDDLLRADMRLVPLILGRAVGCVVTKDEHAVLTALPKSIEGWARYSAAGLTVVDMATGVAPDDPADLDSVYGGIDLDEASALVYGGPARLCLLAACRMLEPNLGTGLAVELAVRDSESVEGWWLGQRLALMTGDLDLAAISDWAQAISECGRRFRSNPDLSSAHR